MSIETPSSDAEANSVEAVMKKLITTYIQFSPEYKKLNFTDAEIEEAARRLSNAEVSGSDKEIAKKALDAQLGARRSARVSESTPVLNREDSVIGMAKSQKEADALVRNDNETRDAA